MTRNPKEGRALPMRKWKHEVTEMRGILLWALGVPIPIIILIYLLF